MLRHPFILIAMSVGACSLFMPSSPGSELEGAVAFRVTNHSKDRITEVILTREEAPGVKRAFRYLVGGPEKNDVEAIQPGAQHEFKVKAGTYTIGLTAFPSDAGYHNSTGYKKDVDCTGAREVTYEDKRGTLPKDSGEWKQIVLVNSQTPDESKRSDVKFVNSCKREVEVLTRNYGTRPHGHGKLQPGAQDSESVIAYGAVGMLRPSDGSEAWFNIQPGPLTVEIASTCDSLGPWTTPVASASDDALKGKTKPKKPKHK